MTTLNEHKKLSLEDRKILLRCREAIHAIDSTADIILYGSRARGTAQEDSDYDLLILTDRSVDVASEGKFREKLFPIELESARVLSMIAFSRMQWNTPLWRSMPLSRNIEIDGVLL